MVERIKALITRYRELIMYGIFGALSTLINIAAFYVLYDVLHIWYIAADIGAWVVAFIFAFITNKLFVFESKEWNSRTAIREMIGFFTARVATGALDVLLMWLFVDVAGFNELLSKIIVNVLVIIINYVASKFFIFKNGSGKDKK